MLYIVILRRSISRPFSTRFVINNATISAALVGHGFQLLGHVSQCAPAWLRHCLFQDQWAAQCMSSHTTNSHYPFLLFTAPVYQLTQTLNGIVFWLEALQDTAHTQLYNMLATSLLITIQHAVHILLLVLYCIVSKLCNWCLNVLMDDFITTYI